MAEYKAIRGHTIRTIAGDASPLIAGDIWYSSTTKKIRGAKLVASWSSGGNLNEAKRLPTGIGSQTAALACGGNNSGPITVNVEQYDGSAWTEITNMGSGKYTSMNAGTVTCLLYTSDAADE